MPKTNTNNSTIDINDYFTMYVVRDATKRVFLNRAVYTGRARGVWGKMGDAQLFSTPQKAQSCASNIARRDPGCRVPEVRPVFVKRLSASKKTR